MTVVTGEPTSVSPYLNHSALDTKSVNHTKRFSFKPRRSYKSDGGAYLTDLPIENGRIITEQPFRLMETISWTRPEWLIPINTEFKDDRSFDLPESVSLLAAFNTHWENDHKVFSYQPALLDPVALKQEQQKIRSKPPILIPSPSLQSHDESRLEVIRSVRRRQPEFHRKNLSNINTKPKIKKKDSRKGGRRQPLPLPGAYGQSSGDPTSPHSFEGALKTLDISEKNFISKVRLDPRVYCHARDSLAERYQVSGVFNKTAAQKMFRMDVNKTGKSI